VSPDIARDFIHVDDVVEAYLAAAAARGSEPGAVYNVGTGRETSIGRAVEIARKVLSLEAEPQWDTMPKRSWDTTTWVANPAKIERELGFRPAIGFEEGFSRFARWVAANPGYRARAASNRSRFSQSRR
jgi:nucleoside-diphosphate-sugar epimerase